MTESEKIAVIYHSIFNYSLSKEELTRWRAGKSLTLSNKRKISFKPQPKSLSKQKINDAKMSIARKAAKSLSSIPTILFVGVTGSLAMNNAKRESDIDLMVITEFNTLWISRIYAYFLLSLLGYSLRRAGNKDERDKLCLNLWIDESALAWSGPKNAYIAHEIAQVVPLVNKSKTYEKWINKNRWVKEYWPNANRKIKPTKASSLHSNPLVVATNSIFFVIQSSYMSSKKTREYVSKHEAFFHPYDWGAKVLATLSRRGVSHR